ncbi:YebC/PmpR family DNA-binding transcriptional regulator [Desulfomicrobium orale]|uniref:Probable transcriptional regulatory protein AXF15_11440 n=1 Tax=Desulfomicrobium orale DSM 12838 TaxID=888061 RepID=A0A0X8JRR2_9BACT|nr:YebC/PmpR family DNA-binding transcriptional regulator [Desulfomicrobium orale]AMD93652.1 transcriptional regulator [Desulfomicrobium orale DSM 12838]
MAGHSKWKNIQHRKGRQDAKRGKMFTKVTKEIILAAKGGGDPAMNARLRAAIDAAKAVNLPKDKIDTAIKKGTGELASEALEEIIYEGYAPGGVALLIEAVTDNKNRTVAEVRHILSKNGGSMGAAGCVAWMFDRKGVFAFDKELYTEDQLLEVGLEAGVEDVLDDDDSWQVQCSVEDFHAARAAFEAAGIEPLSADLSRIPQNLVAVDVETGRKALRLYDALDDNDDVQNVYTNFELPPELVAEME